MTSILTSLLPQTKARAAAAPTKSFQEVEAFLKANKDALRDSLKDYNQRVVKVSSINDTWNISSLFWEIESLEGDRVYLIISYGVGRAYWEVRRNAALFELRWNGDRLDFVGHHPVPQTAGTQPESRLELSASSTGGSIAPVMSAEDLDAYLKANQDKLREQLESYNKQVIKLSSTNDTWNIGSLFWEIEDLIGDRVLLVIKYGVGRAYWEVRRNAALFELRWKDDALEIVGHGPVPKSASNRKGWLGDAEPARGRCLYNYYAPRPCIDTVRRWTEFAEFNDLPLNPETAAIFQAYRYNDTTTGDRMLARFRGQPDPTGESAFDLQAEIAALDLRRYQETSEVACDLNPYGPRPCAEIARKFKSFARRHGLSISRGTATMFESYVNGDFRRADTLYAFAKGLPVPAYGYVPTGIARDSALAALRDPSVGAEIEPCTHNPYDLKPCLDSTRHWRNFAARYALEDNARNARVFAAYADGEMKLGDRLFAQAKGVSLDQLLEAAGVPTDGLVIEVYPGRRQQMRMRITGS